MPAKASIARSKSNLGEIADPQEASVSKAKSDAATDDAAVVKPEASTTKRMSRSKSATDKDTKKRNSTRMSITQDGDEAPAARTVSISTPGEAAATATASTGEEASAKRMSRSKSANEKDTKKRTSSASRRSLTKDDEAAAVQTASTNSPAEATSPPPAAVEEAPTKRMSRSKSANEKDTKKRASSSSVARRSLTKEDEAPAVVPTVSISTTVDTQEVDVTAPPSSTYAADITPTASSVATEEGEKKMTKRSSSKRASLGSLTAKQKAVRAQACRVVCAALYQASAALVDKLLQEDRKLETWLFGSLKLPPAKNLLDPMFEPKLLEVVKLADPYRTGSLTKAGLVKVFQEHSNAAQLFGLTVPDMPVEKQEPAFRAILHQDPYVPISWEAFFGAYGLEAPAKEVMSPGAEANDFSSPATTLRSSRGGRGPCVPSPDAKSIHEGTLILTGKGRSEEPRYFKLHRGCFQSFPSAMEGCAARRPETAAPAFSEEGGAEATAPAEPLTVSAKDINGIYVGERGFRVSLAKEVLELRVPDEANLMETHGGPPRTLDMNPQSGEITLKKDLEYVRQPLGKVPDEELKAEFVDDAEAFEVMRELAALTQIFQAPLHIVLERPATASQATTPRAASVQRTASKERTPATASAAADGSEMQRAVLADRRAALWKAKLSALGVDASRLKVEVKVGNKNTHHLWLQVAYNHILLDWTNGRIGVKTELQFRQKKYGKAQASDPPIGQFEDSQLAAAVLGEVSRVCLLFQKPVTIIFPKTLRSSSGNKGKQDWLQELTQNRAGVVADTLRINGLPEKLVRISYQQDMNLQFHVDLKACSGDATQELVDLWARAWQLVVGAPLQSRRKAKSPSRSPQRALFRRAEGRSPRPKSHRANSGPAAGKQESFKMPDCHWKPPSSFAQELNNPMVKDFIDTLLYNPPLHYGTVGVAERGTVAPRFAILYKDRLEAYSKPLDAVHNMAPRLTRRADELLSFQPFSHGVVIKCKASTLSFFVPDSSELASWRAALVTMMKQLKEMPVDWILEDCEFIGADPGIAGDTKMTTKGASSALSTTGGATSAGGKENNKPRRRALEELPKHRRLAAEEAVQRRAASVPPLRGGSSSSGSKGFQLINTHNGAREAHKLLHGQTAYVLRRSDMPGGALWMKAQVEGKVPDRDPKSPRMNVIQPVVGESLVGDRSHYFSHTTPRELPGQLSWAKVNHNDFGKLSGDRSVTPRPARRSSLGATDLQGLMAQTLLLAN
mmetsp:Transcript_3815/g.8925  ORF Transcript_3815/g.8925 Transcript_3815/m.8925 type:complete len:1247 (+) Transcript_3815:91-3831(+)